MKGIGWFIASVALVAVLIPFPELLWFSLAGLALIWLATPSSPRKGKGRS